MGPGVEQRRVGEVVLAHELAQDLLVERAQVEHAQLAAVSCHVLDDLVRAALAKRHLVLVGVHALEQAHERVHDEGVVLRRYGEQALGGACVGIALLHELGLLQDLARVGEELRAVGRE